MQINKILLLSFFSLVVSLPVNAARWDGATVDMSGSETEHDWCDYARPIFDEGRARIWDVQCGNKQTPVTILPDIVVPQEPEFPADPYQEDPDKFWENWEKEMDKIWQDDTTQQDIQETRNKKVWSSQTATQMVDIWVYEYTQSNGLRSGYLDLEMMSDLNHNRYMFNELLNNCLTTKIYNDFANVTNLVNSGKDERASHWMAGMLRDCYYQVRGF